MIWPGWNVFNHFRVLMIRQRRDHESTLMA
jgi:hypothetical protein